MHTRDDLNCSRGYEWDVLREARKRNGAIKTYGLSWGVPGWIGGGNYYSDDNLEYHLWLYCASVVQQVPIDFMGKCTLHAWWRFPDPSAPRPAALPNRAPHRLTCVC